MGFNKEPTLLLNGLSELLRQILPLLVVIGVVHLEPEKLAGLISIIGLVLAFISTTVLRSQVVSTEKADQQIRVAVNSPSGTSVDVVKDKVEAQTNL